MTSRGLGCLIVVIKAFPVGIITERDIVRRIVAKRNSVDLKVTDAMTKMLITVDPDTSLKEAARVMSTNKIRRLPVLKNNKLIRNRSSLRFCAKCRKKDNHRRNTRCAGSLPNRA